MTDPSGSFHPRHFPESRKLPRARGPVIACRGSSAPVSGDSYGCNTLAVSLDLEQHLTSFRIKQPHGAKTSSQQTAIARDGKPPGIGLEPIVWSQLPLRFEDQKS